MPSKYLQRLRLLQSRLRRGSHELWIRILKYVKLRRLRTEVWARSRKIEMKSVMRHSGALSEDDVIRLGEWVETPTYQSFLKYCDIERWAQINNGMIQAKDARECGEVQGAVGQLNKIESDLSGYHADMQEIRKRNTVDDEADDVEEDATE